jgi:DNA polymerase III delta subunit
MKAQSAPLAVKGISLGKAAPGYFVFGEEAYWHRRLVQTVAASFPGAAESLAGDEMPWEALRDLLAQPSFFGPQLWVIREAQSMFAVGDDRWIDGIPERNCLILTCPVKDNPAPAAFLEKWERLGGRLVEAVEPSFPEAAKWVTEKVSRDGFKVTGEAVESLVSIAGRSIERLEKELEKIETYMGAAQGGTKLEIAAHVVLQCASQDPDKTSFGLIDAVAARNAGRAIAEYLDLKARGANPVMVIALLASHFGLVWRAKEAELKGISQSDLPKALGVHPYSARKASQEARHWTFSQLESALSLMCTVDEKVKRGRMDPERAMDYLLSSLCSAQ